ncbi:MAG: hypothetical protein K8S54_21180 [Spirochaetia bacterium]|nr:hypothetical protein [Spirochaetia bacterium]
MLTNFNFSRFSPGQIQGHYESFFQRANHPELPLAFWIRYTIFNPHKQPENAIGELWAIYFDGQTGQHTAVKSEFPMSECSFDQKSFNVKVSDSILSDGKLRGDAVHSNGKIEWDLSFTTDHQPLFDFPLSMYQAALPRAKVLVGHPLARFNGNLKVNGRSIPIENWIGSQNHNWGSKHTDHYAWGQVAGFQKFPETFLELATARLKIGPIWTPAMTPIVLRHRGKEYRLNSLIETLRRASFGYFWWDFQANTPEIQIKGQIRATRNDFICLKYYNPPGGFKYCLNSKIASCHLEIKTPDRLSADILDSSHNAAFEILTDSDDHGLSLSC